MTPTNSPGSSDKVLIGIPNAESSCPPGSTSSLCCGGHFRLRISYGLAGLTPRVSVSHL